MHSKVLVAGRQGGVASLRNCQRLPLCRTEPMSAGSKEDPSLAKVKPINDNSRTSRITVLRGEVTAEQQLQLQQRSENI